VRYLSGVVLDESCSHVIRYPDVKMLTVETFQEVDVFHDICWPKPAVALRAMAGQPSLASLRTGMPWLAQPKLAKRAKAGGARRDRTADLIIANDALSQLSYGPIRDRLDRTRRLAIGVIYNPRQGQVKNGRIGFFPFVCRDVPLFGRCGTDI
jgi:hypothetical protein